MKTYLSMGAEFSAYRAHRYSLTRQLGPGTSTVLFVGLNPSTASEKKDDPTIRREVGFAERWGFDWYLKGNLYAFRSTNPKGLWAVKDPMGPENRAKLRMLVTRAELVIAAWGGFEIDCQGRDIADWILSLEKTQCLGQNKDGSPVHPLYLPADTMPRRYVRT